MLIGVIGLSLPFVPKIATFILVAVMFFYFYCFGDEEREAYIQAFIASLKKDDAKVLEICMSALKNNWKNLRFYTGGTASALELNQIDKAELLVQRAFEINPEHRNTTLAMFSVKAYKKECKEAEVFAQKALELIPESKTLIYYERYNMYLATFDTVKAIENLDKLESLNHKDAPKWGTTALRVHALIAANKFDQALELAKKNHSEWFDKLPSVRKAALDYNLGDALMSNNLWSEAVELYTRAFKNDPKMAIALAMRANCYIELLELDLARADIDQFERLNTNIEFKYLASCVRASLTENADEALKIAEQAILEQPNIPLTHFTLARVLLRKQELEKAIASLDRAIEINSSYVEAYELRATTRKTLGDSNENEADGKKKSVTSDTEEDYMMKASEFVEKNDSMGAIKVLTEGIAKQPNNGDLYSMRGVHYHLIGKNEESLEDLDKAIELTKDDLGLASMYSNKAITEIALKHPERADRAFQKALSFKAPYYIIQLEYGKFLIDQGKTAKGIEYLKTAKSKLAEVGPEKFHLEADALMKKMGVD
jgi:tetratricopeptide (TPR) repeat protein